MYQNSWSWSQNQDILIYSKSNKIMKLNFQLTKCWMMKLKKKSTEKGHKKSSESTGINPLNIILGSWGQNNII